ncbi:hypothetical protein UCRPA7_8562 [Phaeoacremonium minimum UCRPA7]|uniref:Uncharacterized protein n=1 Tax=Phaeoacremonium minimum (strain UCR-PA7) TaxID=1286976 RepID=R8B9I2_PHAM7|nr:hypothetical protein UCRPA7_8562 [Phaeoacremonium minimum UCRPA7]EON95946.1 hypothetical protein UCRPA7_8562 [Phaeoacremonium minimum UCRPA7]
MKSILAITTLLASAAVGGLAAPPSSPAGSIMEIQTGQDMQLMMEPHEILAIKECMQHNAAPDLVADYSQEGSGTAMFSHLPGICCEVLKKAVKKHGWFPNFGQIGFGGGDQCTEVKLTDVPSAKFKLLKKLTGTGPSYTSPSTPRGQIAHEMKLTTLVILSASFAGVALAEWKKKYTLPDHWIDHCHERLACGKLEGCYDEEIYSGQAGEMLADLPQIMIEEKWYKINGCIRKNRGEDYFVNLCHKEQGVVKYKGMPPKCCEMMMGYMYHFALTKEVNDECTEITLRNVPKSGWPEIEFATARFNWDEYIAHKRKTYCKNVTWDNGHPTVNDGDE